MKRKWFGSVNISGTVGAGLLAGLLGQGVLPADVWAQNSGSSAASSSTPAAAQGGGAAAGGQAGAANAALQAQLTVENMIGAIVPAVGPKYRDVQDAIDLFLKNDAAGAQNAMERAVKNNPELPPAPLLMAKMYFAANNGKAAAAEIAKAINTSPADPEAYLVQGDINLQQQQTVPAQLLYEQALTKAEAYDANPKRKGMLISRAYSGMAFVSQAAEDWKKAEEHLRNCLKTAAESEQNSVKERLALVLFRQATPESRKACYELFGEIWESDKANRLRPEISMARLFDQIDNNIAQAEKLMRQAQTRDTTLQTQLAVAQWAMEADKLDLAKLAADAAAKADDKSLESKLISGLLARYEGRDPEALNLFVQAHVQSPSNPIALNQIALILINSDNVADQNRAMEYAQVAASVYSRFDQNHARESAITLAWVLHKKGRSREAGEIVRSVLNQPGTVDSASLYFAAEVLHNLGQDDPAKKILDAVLKSGKNFLNKAKATDLRKTLG